VLALRDEAPRVVRVFPQAANVLRLGTAHAVERYEHWIGRRYIPARTAAPAEESIMPAA
jgi:hypothetical protein